MPVAEVGRSKHEPVSLDARPAVPSIVELLHLCEQNPDTQLDGYHLQRILRQPITEAMNEQYVELMAVITRKLGMLDLAALRHLRSLCPFDEHFDPWYDHRGHAHCRICYPPKANPTLLRELDLDVCWMCLGDGELWHGDMLPMRKCPECDPWNI